MGPIRQTNVRKTETSLPPVTVPHTQNFNLKERKLVETKVIAKAEAKAKAKAKVRMTVKS